MLKKNKFIKKYISHPLELAFANFFFFILRLMPTKWASNFGGFIARKLGLLSGKYRRIISTNMKIAFPDSTAQQRAEWATQMWDMLGRMITEPPHFPNMYKNIDKYITIENREIIEKLKGRAFVGFTFHGGGVGPGVMAFEHIGIKGAVMYRAPKNKMTDGILTAAYGRRITNMGFLPANIEGAKGAVKTLSEGGAIIIAPDHRARGARLPFFGRECETPLGAAAMARKFNCPLLPVRIIREGGTKSRVVFYEPFMPDSDDNITMQKMNAVMESWIRDIPAQWFWVHNRWGLKKDEFVAMADK